MKRALALVLLGVAGCATVSTQQAVSASFGQVFAGRYVAQQGQQGRTDVNRSALRPAATCARSGTAADGPGEDWICTVRYTDGVTSGTQVFEVQVKPDGCWKADGPPSVQPAQVVDALTGVAVSNPLAEFDGCLDTGW